MKRYLLFLLLFLAAAAAKADEVSIGVRKVHLGIRVFPKGEIAEWTDDLMDEAFEKAKEGGFSISIHSHYWKDFEKALGRYKWDGHDNNLDYTLWKTRTHRMTYLPIFEVIHTNRPGEYPEGVGFTRFDSPRFLDAFKKFIRAYIEHIGGDLEYFIVGNEVDLYLHENPHLKSSFRNFYREVVAEVHRINPGIRVGVIGAYHLARRSGEIEYLRELGKEGDLLVLTVYMEDDRSLPDVTQTESYFNRMFGEFEGLKIGIVEAGWSSKGRKGSYDNQVEFVKRYSRVLEQNREQLEFASLFLLYDLPDELNRMVASSFGIEGENRWVREFLAWQGSLGIIENDGTEKPVWRTLQKYMK